MDAKQAKEITDKAQLGKSSDLIKVFTEIEKSAKNGDYIICWFGELTIKQVGVLESKHYTVSFRDNQLTNPYYVISWGKA